MQDEEEEENDTTDSRPLPSTFYKQTKTTAPSTNGPSLSRPPTKKDTTKTQVAEPKKRALPIFVQILILVAVGVVIYFAIQKFEPSAQSLIGKIPGPSAGAGK